MLASSIWEFDGETMKIWAEGPELEAPNGLLVQGASLIVAGWGLPEADFSTKVPGRLLKIDLQTKKVSAITASPLGNLDGLEADGRGGFFVSDWMEGKIYRVNPDGEATLLLEGAQGTADISYIPAKKTLIVPAMNENLIRAYKL